LEGRGAPVQFKPARTRAPDGDDVRELVADLPERVRIWRGAVRGINEGGLSWAVSREDAVPSAHRNVGLHDEGESVVLRASVARGDVIALFVERPRNGDSCAP
jgi:hypothetical protein